MLKTLLRYIIKDKILGKRSLNKKKTSKKSIKIFGKKSLKKKIVKVNKIFGKMDTKKV